jgi:hypothetical protein
MTVASDNPVRLRAKSRGLALTLLSRKLRPEKNGKLDDAEKKLVNVNEFLKGWDADKAAEKDTQDRIAKLQADQEKDLEELEKLAGEASGGSDEAAVKLLKEAQAAHSSLSDADLVAATRKLDGEIEALRGKATLLSVEANRRAMVKALSEKLNVNTAMDRAILEQVIGPGRAEAKAKINKPS